MRRPPDELRRGSRARCAVMEPMAQIDHQHEDVQSVLERLDLNYQLDVVGDGGNEGLHAEVGALDLAREVAAAPILLAARMLATIEVGEIERDRFGDADQGQFAFDH